MHTPAAHGETAGARSLRRSMRIRAATTGILASVMIRTFFRDRTPEHRRASDPGGFMEESMKLHGIAFAVLICMGLTACDKQFESEVTRTETSQGVDSTTYRGKLTIKWKRAAEAMSATTLDVSQLAIDITGYGTLVPDSAGTGTLILKQGTTVVASTSFAYVILDSMAVAADPAALNAWVAQYPSADGFDVELAQIPTIDIEEGVAILAMDTVYGAEVISSTNTSWASSVPTCEPNNGNGGWVPEMPIELPGEGTPCP